MFLLSFDIEEFDMPFEYGKVISFEDQINISATGTTIILDLLKKHGFRATFFSTVIFARQVPEIIERIKNEGHELASHSYYHSEFKPEDLLESRKVLENLSGMPVTGFRMPRMMPVSDEEIEAAGYKYNTSINPTWLPGRYNNLHISRTVFKTGRVFQVPASVSPLMRIPLFWLSMHNFPAFYYRYLLKKTYENDGYVNIYFHPWEFTDLSNRNYGLPGYVSRNSGDRMLKRMDSLFGWIKSEGYPDGTISELVEKYKLTTSLHLPE